MSIYRTQLLFKKPKEIRAEVSQCNSRKITWMIVRDLLGKYYHSLGKYMYYHSFQGKVLGEIGY